MPVLFEQPSTPASGGEKMAVGEFNAPKQYGTIDVNLGFSPKCVIVKVTGSQNQLQALRLYSFAMATSINKQNTIMSTENHITFSPTGFQFTTGSWSMYAEKAASYIALG